MDHFTQDDLRRLLQAARGCRERDWLMILVAFWHGLRASEVTGLTDDSVQDGFLVVTRLKGKRKGKGKSVRTTQELVTHADPLLDERAPLIDLARKSNRHERLFPISRQQFFNLMRKYGALAGLPKHRCHPHALKHSIAMQTIDKWGVHRVQKWLGHKSIASTGMYLHADEDVLSAEIAEVATGPGSRQRRLID